MPVLAGVGKTFGLVFEEYVQRILDEAFGERLIRLPRSDQTKRADGLIVYPNRLVVYEIKSKHARAAGRRGPRTVEEREQELVDIGVGDAAEQLAATMMFSGGTGISEESWSGTFQPFGRPSHLFPLAPYSYALLTPDRVRRPSASLPSVIRDHAPTKGRRPRRFITCGITSRPTMQPSPPF